MREEKGGSFVLGFEFWGRKKKEGDDIRADITAGRLTGRRIKEKRGREKNFKLLRPSFENGEMKGGEGIFDNPGPPMKK